MFKDPIDNSTKLQFALESYPVKIFVLSSSSSSSFLYVRFYRRSFSWKESLLLVGSRPETLDFMDISKTLWPFQEDQTSGEF